MLALADDLLILVSLTSEWEEPRIGNLALSSLRPRFLMRLYGAGFVAVAGVCVCRA